MIRDRQWDYIIVGSGAGGSTAAREIAKRNKQVLVIEAGPEGGRMGDLRGSMKFYDRNRLAPAIRRSREGVGIVRALIAGGSTIVSCGNGVRCLENELRELGLDLSGDFAEAEEELHVGPIASRLYSKGSRALIEAGGDLGYSLDPMPKFIDAERCRKCGDCIFGCVHGAKWTALHYLKEAIDNGADVLYETEVHEVLVDGGKARGVRAASRRGSRDIYAKAVIIAAGGIGTPILLQHSGIKEAGGNLFIDPLITTYGVTDSEQLSQVHEPSMTFVDLEFHESKGFLLSTAAHNGGILKYFYYGLGALLAPDKRTLAMMTKIADEPVGRVYPDGSISKPLTGRDWSRLKEGSAISKEILKRAGAKRFGVSGILGAHPGGTAAIGKIVDKDLQTGIDGLFVADASVLPVSPGLPPILTIVALAKHLGKALP